jgi:hypothetical protein
MVIPLWLRLSGGSTRAAVAGKPSHSHDGTLVFSSGALNELEDLNPGNVILSGPTSAAPYGFLKKVQAVRVDGDQVIVTTVDATLEEVFEEVEIEVRKELSLADVMGAPKMSPKVTLNRERSTQDGFWRSMMPC